MNTCTQEGVTVSQPGMSVSFTTGTGMTGVILNVSRHYRNLPNEFGGKGRFKLCDANGKVFKTQDEAKQYALEHGYIREWFKAYNPVRKQQDKELFWKYTAKQKGLVK